MLRRRPFGHSGVSEVVGTILVLLITVIIFSSILLWVYSLPAPPANTRVSMAGTLDPIYVGGVWQGAEVKLTHLGGENLNEANTRVYLTIDNTTHTLHNRGFHFDGVSVKPYGIEGLDGTWNIGEGWVYRNESLPESAQVSVLLVDIVRGTIVWRTPLLGVGGERPPVFLDKWTDAHPASPTRDQVKPQDKFTLLARVFDADGDLNPGSVWAYLTFGTGGVPIGYVQLVDNGDPAAGDARAGDGVFTRAVNIPAEKAWDGGIVILNATDAGGRETQTRLILEVLNLGGPLQKGPEGLAFGSDLQRFDIFNETEWDEHRWSAQSTRTFKKGETVVVVVASKYLPNLDQTNSFLLYDPFGAPGQAVVYSGTPYNQPVTTTSLPSSAAAFQFEEFIGGFYVWIQRFSTDSADHGYDGVQLSFGQYSLVIDIKADVVEPPKNRFWVTDAITVTDQFGSSPDYPQILLFKDPLHTQPTTVFNFTETLYVVVQVRSTDGTFTMGDVLVQDAIKGIQVWASPGSAPISPAAINNSGLDLRRYAFSVDLSRPNFDPWLIGFNAYSFSIRILSDLDEQYVGALSRQIQIQGPRWLMDIMIAMQEFEHPVFDEEIFGYFYRHDAEWGRLPYELFQSTPQQPDPEFGQGPFRSIAFGDFDKDGDLDGVVGIENGAVLLYRNTRGDGTQWARRIVDFDAGGRVNGVATGDIDRDGDVDMAVGTEAGNLWVYENDGLWTARLVDAVAPQINDVELGDMTGDGVNDIVVALSNGRIHVYLNDGAGGFGPTLVDDYYAGGELTLLGTRAGSYLDTLVEDDVYEALTEVWSPGYIPIEVIQDGVFAAGLLAWPIEANFPTQGLTAWDTESAVLDGSGSLRAENDLGVGRRFAGYRAQLLATPIPPSTLYDLSLSYRKAYIGTPPVSQALGVILEYADGFTQTVWSNSAILNSATWTGAMFSGTTSGIHGNVTAVRLAYDVRGQPPGASQAAVWFDDVSLQMQIPSGDTSRLEHNWIIPTVGAGGSAYQFKVQAHHTPNVEGDHFTLYFSLDDISYSPMLTIPGTADDDTYRGAILPPTVGGRTVYIKALDTNGISGNLVNDTLFVDHLLISRITAIAPNVVSIPIGSRVNDVAIGDVDGDGDMDIAAAAQNGNVYVAFNLLGDGTSWSTTAIPASGSVLSVDVGDLDNDGDLDIVGGTGTGRVMTFLNLDGIGATWSITTVATGVGEVLALEVGDVEGDFWDDIVIVTDVGNVIYYQNNQAAGWVSNAIDFIEEPVFGVAIGDVDRGVIG